MDALQQVYGEVRDAGGELIVFTPQLAEHSAKLIEDHNLGFPIICDEDQALGEKLGLVFEFPDDLREVYQGLGADLAAVNGEDSFRLPMPARFLVDQDQLIRDSAVNPDYTRRPEPSDMVDLLKMLG